MRIADSFRIVESNDDTETINNDYYNKKKGKKTENILKSNEYIEHRKNQKPLFQHLNK